MFRIRTCSEKGAGGARVAYGRPIVEYQLVQAMLAPSFTELFAARAMLYEAASQLSKRGVRALV